MNEIVEKNNNSNNIVISKDIESLVLESQKILLEFFKNNTKNFDSDKLKSMKDTFSTYSVVSKKGEEIHFYNGRCDHETKTIKVRRDPIIYFQQSQNGMTREYIMMAVIIHEYGHAFAKLCNINARILDEGMQIILEEMVMNYYFSTRNINAYHQNIGYGPEHKSLARTLLYTQLKDNNDIDVLSEYLFGDKQKFLSMIFSKDFIKDNNLKIENLVSLMTKKNIYNLFLNQFDNIDESSIYGKNNNIIYTLWLQKYIDEDILDDPDFNCTSRQDILEKYKEKYGEKAVFEHSI